MSLEPANAALAWDYRVKEETDEQQEHAVRFKEETDGQQELIMQVKEEAECTGGLDSSWKCNVKQETGLLELYAGHKVEEDLVLGPEELQQLDRVQCPMSTTFSLESVNSGECRVKEETDRQQEHIIQDKEEAECTGGLDARWKCDVKEESGLLELYVGHKVEADLVLGPERMQPPDSAFVQPAGGNSRWAGSSSPAPREVPGRSGPPEPSGQDAGRRALRSGEPNNYLTQKQTHTGSKTHFCEVCLKQFKNENLLDKHRNIHTAKKIFQCDVCMKKFTTKWDLKRHGQTHTGEKPYSCELCMKQFRRKSAVNVHERTHTHTREKPFSCDVCMKQFTRKNSLIDHIGTHTGEKPYSCEVCMKQFIKKSDLNNHGRTHTGEKPYSCEVCTKQFTKKSTLKIHGRTHTGEKPYSCEVCMKQFRRKGHLKIHGRTHTGEKPYSCEVCMKQFRRKSHLKIHRRTHTGDTPYSCEVCMKQYTQRCNLTVHIYKNHTIQ